MTGPSTIAELPIFLSVVLVVRNQSARLAQDLRSYLGQICGLVSDFELIVVDNASTDGSVSVLKLLTAPDGLPNLQVFALTKEVDADAASWAGVERSLGDFVVVIDPLQDDIGFMPTMLLHAVQGSDVVFARNLNGGRQALSYRIAAGAFNAFYKVIAGINLADEAPHFRVLSRRVVNFILQHPMPALAFRHLPATAGFARENLVYTAALQQPPRKRLLDSIDRGMSLLVSSTRVPMRLVTMLSLFGAFANVVYTAYVIAIALFKSDVAPGWVTLSLQQSGMFLLISLVLLVLGEYILHTAVLANEGPKYHVAQDFTSAILTRTRKLNVEDAHADGPSPAGEPINPTHTG